MKVLLAGADGALGTPLTRLLVARGHTVLGLIRNPAGVPILRARGVEPIVADALNREGLLRAVDRHSADAVIHECTALKKPPTRASRMTKTNRLRNQGTSDLRAAAVRICANRDG